MFPQNNSKILLLFDTKSGLLLALYILIAQHLVREPSSQQTENGGRRPRRRRTMIQRHQNSHRSRR